MRGMWKSRASRTLKYYPVFTKDFTFIISIPAWDYQSAVRAAKHFYGETVKVSKSPRHKR